MITKPFGWRRTFDYFKVNLYLMWRTLIEYKINFFSSIWSEFINVFVMFMFFKVITDNFSDVIPWTTGDFMLYYVIYAIIYTLAGHFFWKDNLFNLIKNGDLNLYINKPINQTYFYLFSKLSSNSFVMMILYCVFLLLTIIYFELVITNIFLGLSLCILVVILIIFFYHFLYSLDLISLGLSSVLLTPVFGIRTSMELYPEPFFKQNFIKFILMGITPMFFVSSLILPIFRNYDIWNFKLQIIILFSFILILIFGTFFNWHYGLKRYVAFS